MYPSLVALLSRQLALESAERYPDRVSKRDYGQTTSSLLANQQHRFEAQLRKAADKNFELAGVLAREQAVRARLERFLEEKGLLDQWQCDEE